MPASPADTQSPQSVLLDFPVNRFPATYFLDRQSFNHCHMSIERGHLPPSSIILQNFGNADDIRQAATKYFTSVHLWFPIISRSKFYGYFLHGSFETDVEISLLALCMRILGSRPPNGIQVQDADYISIKQAFVKLEQVGVLNLTVLQALLLTALYEIGHGIYPAAHFTIGQCSKYAVALDLDREILKWNASDWVMMEEKHRAWWAILMLDRYINSFTIIYFTTQSDKHNEKDMPTSGVLTEHYAPPILCNCSTCQWQTRTGTKEYVETLR